MPHAFASFLSSVDADVLCVLSVLVVPWIAFWMSGWVERHLAEAWPCPPAGAYRTAAGR